VMKIVEEHFGSILFTDRPGGGTMVRLSFDIATLASLVVDGDGRADGDDPGLPALTRMKS